MAFDVERVRALYPAFTPESGRRTVYLDGAAGTQSPTSVIEAIADAYRLGTSNAGGFFEASQRADAYTAQARAAIADLVNGSPDGVVLGPNMTTLTYRFAQALSATWEAGDNIVVSQLDHDSNVRPWVQWARRADVQVRWALVDVSSGELPTEQYDHLIDDRTRLVAVTAASNVLGTQPDVAAITARAHQTGALAYVDGVHSTAHGVTDIVALGADFYATSAYKWDGPHVGAVIADPGLLATLHPDKLSSSSDDVPDRFEWGTPSFANYAGVAAAVDHLAELDALAAGTRRERLVTSLSAAHDHEDALFSRLWSQLKASPKITCFGPSVRRTATAYFCVADQKPDDVAANLAMRGINVWSGHNYAWEVTAALGIRDSGSAVRASLGHANNDADVDALLAALGEL